VLGASTVTNVPTSVIYGNVGVWGGTSVTGFASTSGVAVSDPQVTEGLVHSATGLAQSAQAQLTTARNDLASLGVGTLLTSDLAGLTLAPGVYTVPAGATNLSGALILDGGGNANAAWVFQMPSTLNHLAQRGGEHGWNRVGRGPFLECRQLGGARHLHDIYGQHPRADLGRRQDGREQPVRAAFG
jgi:hypothetical protein